MYRKMTNNSVTTGRSSILTTMLVCRTTIHSKILSEWCCSRENTVVLIYSWNSKSKKKPSCLFDCHCKSLIHVQRLCRPYNDDGIMHSFFKPGNFNSKFLKHYGHITVLPIYNCYRWPIVHLRSYRSQPRRWTCRPCLKIAGNILTRPSEIWPRRPRGPPPRIGHRCAERSPMR